MSERELSGMSQAALWGELTPARRRVDELWDAVMECYGLDADELSKSERGRYNAKVAELRKIGADPGEIGRRRENYRMRFPHAADTFAALVSHWAESGSSPRSGPGQTLGAIARLAKEG